MMFKKYAAIHWIWFWVATLIVSIFITRITLESSGLIHTITVLVSGWLVMLVAWLLCKLIKVTVGKWIGRHD